ncbi:OCIA domain-containing protein 1-like [Brachionichthys hirsutus]|uniref:OCIA domain-containing protein 1-like n=1 Tax=Brachionichthys hirsutus TaxID=412623 RepID=UPI003604BD13
MSSSPTELTEDRQNRQAQTELPRDYVLTEEERRLHAECRSESFWRRALPFAAISAGATSVLIARGTLSPSPRFGAAPKICIAFFFGYLAGKISYLQKCSEKFQRLENSPVGALLRQRAGLSAQHPSGAKSETSDADSQSLETMFQPADAPSQRNPDESFTQTGKQNDFGVPNDSRVDVEEPRRPTVRYEDLRLKNREKYQAALSQQDEALLKPSPEKEPTRREKGVKNIYGDTWEE